MQLAFDLDLWLKIHQYLNDADERAVFLFVQAAKPDSAIWRPVEQWFLDPEKDYDESSELHVALAPHVMPQVFKTAHDTSAAVVEIHGHYWPGDHTRFSTYDVAGLEQLVPQMLWRLPGRPYFALVVGSDSFDGLVWSTRDDARVIEPLQLGVDTLAPTGASLAVWQRRPGGSE